MGWSTYNCTTTCIHVHVHVIVVFLHIIYTHLMNMYNVHQKAKVSTNLVVHVVPCNYPIGISKALFWMLMGFLRIIIDRLPPELHTCTVHVLYMCVVSILYL